jgi:magnesium transporter
MRRLVAGASKKAGLPPGTLQYVGEERAQQAKVTVTEYDEQHVSEREIETVTPQLELAAEPTVTWINVDGLQPLAAVGQLGERFGLHPLVLEDILNTSQRPKMEDFGDYLFVVLKMLYPSGEGTEIVEEQVSLILGPSYVLSVQEREGDVFPGIRERIRHARGRVRKMGADYLAYALVDAIVDGYFLALERLGDRIEFLEEELVINPTTSTLHTIHDLKTQMIFLRKSVWPLREVVNNLMRGESALIRDSTFIYLRDVYDHTIQVIDTIETLRDIVSGMLDIYLSSVSNRMNEVMKVLTVIATMFIPLTFIAGIYGMNFQYMPELQFRWSYPLLWLIMVSTVILMVAYFRRKGWL